MRRFLGVSGVVLLGLASFGFAGCGQDAKEPMPGGEAGPSEVAPGEKLVTILATNDIHGGVDAQSTPDGPLGGLAHWAGVVRSIRLGLGSRLGKDSGVLVVDAGDQFQGTLLSNYDEGQLVFRALGEIGYDAVVPGNHDYDFGPIGWLEDQVSERTEDKNPRGALERLVSQARFPLLSANTFFKDSIVDRSGRPLDGVTASGCAPRSRESEVDWRRARRPRFLAPSVVKSAAGVRVAFIGIDHPRTPEMTTIENVTDLCFRDPAEAYADARRALQGRADVFVALLHSGDTEKEDSATAFARRVQELGGSGAVHAVIAGHTHFVHSNRAGEVPVVQSGSGMERFGRVDLVWHAGERRVLPQKTRVWAGVKLLHGRCDAAASAFCRVVAAPPGSGVPDQAAYEGVAAAPDPAVSAEIARARAGLAPLASRRVGHTEGVVRRHRYSESPLANALTDALREVAGADVAFINTGGIRDELPAGEVSYEDFFRVLPFSNRGVVVAPMPARTVIRLLERSLKTCGGYGALMQSGLRVRFARDCAHSSGGTDERARLLRVETLKGEVVFDAASGTEPPEGRAFTVTTLDFLSAGGSGYRDFIGVPRVRDLGIVREALVERYLEHPASFSTQVDGRWLETPP